MLYCWGYSCNLLYRNNNVNTAGSSQPPNKTWNSYYSLESWHLMTLQTNDYTNSVVPDHSNKSQELKDFFVTSSPVPSSDNYTIQERTVAKNSSAIIKTKKVIVDPITTKREIGSHRYKYYKCENPHEIQRSDEETPDYSKFDITLIAIASLSRLFELPIFASRWNGPINFVIHLKGNETKEFNQFIHNQSNKILCQERITLLTYVSEPNSFFYSNYPINILRNFGIKHVKTSHLIVVDIDMWFSENSYETLLKLPDVIKNDDKAAVVIPAFFHSGWAIYNGTLPQQVKSIYHRIPYTLNNLTQCIRKRKCYPRKKGLFTHYYTSSRWISNLLHNRMPFAYRYTCWKNKFQEPYLLIKRNDTITTFYEKFINYGFNKIVFVESLRLHAGRMYAFDLPHLPSNYQKTHVKRKNYGIYSLYHECMRKIRKDSVNMTALQFCKNDRNMTMPMF